MEVSKKGVTFNVSDFRKQWWEKTFPKWEEKTFDEIIPHLDKNKYFVDIGAWIGPITLVAQNFSKGCISVEPDPVAFDALEKSVNLNDFNIKLENKALSLEDSLSIGSEKLGISISSYLNPNNTINCDTISLSDLLQKYGLNEENISVIKIDVEGYEKDLLNDPFLQDLNVNFHISFHPQSFKDKNGFYESISKFISPNLMEIIKNGKNIDIFIPKTK